MKILSHFAMAMAILSATAMVTMPQAALAQKEKKEKKKKKKKGKKGDNAQEEDGKPKLSVSEGFYTSYQANKALLDAGNTAGAKAALPAMEALIENDSDAYLYYDFTYSIGKALKDRSLELKGIEKLLASIYLPEANRPIFTFIQGRYALDREEYSLAVTKLTDAYNLGFRRGGIDVLLGIANSNSGQPGEAISWYQKAIDRSTASNSSYDKKSLLGNMAIAAIRSDDAGLIDSTFQNILSQTMDASIWHDGLAQLLAKSNFNVQENLDLLRLMRATDSMLFVQEYVEYMEAADPRRLPNEVLEVVQLGVSKDLIQRSDITFKDFIDIANSRVKADKADLSAAEADARKNTNGNAARATADSLLSFGEYSRAAAMYELAIQKGGADLDRSYNRLGIAQLKNGQFDAARASFASIKTPNRKKIAAYWTIYANNLEASLKPQAAAPVTAN